MHDIYKKNGKKNRSTGVIETPINNFYISGSFSSQTDNHKRGHYVTDMCFSFIIITINMPPIHIETSIGIICGIAYVVM